MGLEAAEQSNAFAITLLPRILTRLGPEGKTLISLNPMGDFRTPILASISQKGLDMGRETPFGIFCLAADRADERKNLMASSGWTGRERKGFLEAAEDE